ncbi:MAG TPA: 2-oxo-hepta-3-ene-1,7-dioic acid hydratase [Gammaproteobacteria bacterium]|nr:2-oxo-hepta-3-ene-1,7-dioic acid hydratase [Gammaproteobacteria bacterium]
MLTSEQILMAAKQLDDAEKNKQPIKPLTLSLEGIGMDDAYAIQKAWVEMKRARGDGITGYKIGLTSRAMQQAMDIDTPDFGVLFESMRFVNGSTIEADDFLDPRIEAEFAFVMKSSLFGEDLSVELVLGATDYVVPALELISARSYRVDPDSGYTRNVFDTIADNAASAGYILGEQRIDPNEADLRWSGALLYVDGIIEETGLGAAVMDHPARGISWVCKRFAQYGVGLETGQTVLSGSFTRPVPISRGTQIRADYGAFGDISVAFC